MWNSHPWECSILYYIKDCYFAYLFSLISLYIQSSIALFKEPSYSVERKRAFIRCYILNIIYFQWIHIQGLVNRQTQNHLNVNLSHLVLFFFCFVILSLSPATRGNTLTIIWAGHCASLRPGLPPRPSTSLWTCPPCPARVPTTSSGSAVLKASPYSEWYLILITQTHTHTHVTVAAWLLSFNSIANSKVWALQ